MLEHLLFALFATFVIIFALLANPASSTVLLEDLTLVRYMFGFVFNALDIIKWY